MTAGRPGPAPIHVPFIVMSVVIAVFGGFVLAIELTLLGALGISNAAWVAQAQVHGHLQAVGFVGLFIVGVAYHLVPGFTGGRALPHPALVTPSLYLIAGGVLARAIGQLGMPSPAFGALAVAGALAEAAGALCAAANVVPGMSASSGRGDPTGPFFLAGTTWFAIQALVGAGWLAATAVGRGSVVPPDQDGALTLLQFFGFHLMFILGVGVRSFPVFFGATRLTLRAVAVPCIAMQLGLALLLVRPMGLAGHAGGGVDGIALLLLGLGVTWMSGLFGWWRPPQRVRPVSRGFAVTLQLALGWLTLVGLIAIGTGAGSLLSGAAPAWNVLDALRHVFAVGVVLTTMVAMAQLILPEFASERFSGAQSPMRGLALGGALAIATVLRAAPRFLDGWLPVPITEWSMTAGGVIALTVVVIFAALFLRGVRRHRALLARFAALAASGEAWALHDASPEPPDRGARA